MPGTHIPGTVLGFGEMSNIAQNKSLRKFSLVENYPLNS